MTTQAPFGMGRVLEPAGRLPQAATRLDPDAPVTGSEIRVEVDYLNLDSASFRDLTEHASGDPARVRAEVEHVVNARGKMQNPRTGSGGMLVGRISATGPEAGVPVGTRVASLVSLTATPLRIHGGLPRWDGRSEVVPVSATAVLPSARTVTPLPTDLPSEIALAVLDVCGAPALVDRVVHRPLISGTVTRTLMLGGGKSAVLSAAAARHAGARAICVVPTEDEAVRLRAGDLFDEVVVADARHPGEVLEAIGGDPQRVDLTVVCVNAPGCDHAALVTTRDNGAVIYFSMATDFAAVALGAEALCVDLDLYVGSGYVPGHADFALDLVRTDPRVRAYFESLTRSTHD